MARLQEFDRELRLATADLEPAQIAPALAAFARASRDEVLAEQAARSGARPEFDVAVNGRLGASEDSVVPPGPIVYSFHYDEEIALFALEAAERLSPVASGAYRRSWFLLAGGAEVAPDAIPPEAPWMLTNDRPYARKIELGAMTMTVPPGICEKVRQLVNARYGNIVRAEVRFIDLAGGYRLKRDHARRGRHRGDAVTYPAVAVTPR